VTTLLGRHHTLYCQYGETRADLSGKMEKDAGTMEKAAMAGTEHSGHAARLHLLENPGDDGRFALSR
jgi:hypothetical protein